MLKFILIVFLFFYLLGIISRSIFRYWIRNTQRDMEHQYEAQQRASRPRKPEGATTVKPTGSSSKKIRKEVGDYVDYEEIK